MMIAEQPPSVDHNLLLPLVRAATACPHLRMDAWQGTACDPQFFAETWAAGQMLGSEALLAHAQALSE